MVVYWDKEAREQLKGIYNFYREIAGIRIAKRIRKEIRNSAQKLGHFPCLGSIIEYGDQQNSDTYRSLVANKNFKIIYQIENKHVYVAAIWDVRQNPSRMGDIIRQ
ncbi:MAG: type II toxin-antitoxin system RelE/ParE family toxin [Tannerella sp.]|jgi:plasmid stabilization system protein ParE|nr:type II toxin-antitoxin system RelE/ParE family toxin [Tannerella sp.]